MYRTAKCPGTPSVGAVSEPVYLDLGAIFDTLDFTLQKHIAELTLSYFLTTHIDQFLILLNSIAKHPHGCYLIPKSYTVAR